MSKNFLVVLALVWATAFGVSLAPLPTLAVAVQPPDPVAATVLVHVWYAEDAWCYGSGVVVGRLDGRALVVTCRHVAPETGGVVTINGTFTGRVEKVDGRGDVDLALLSIVGLPTPPVEIAEDAPPENALLRCHGHTYAEANNSRAFLSDKDRGDVANPAFYLFHAGIDFGDSGSGVFDTSGRLVAVVSAKWKTFGIGIRSRYVKELLR